MECMYVYIYIYIVIYIYIYIEREKEREILISCTQFTGWAKGPLRKGLAGVVGLLSDQTDQTTGQ